MDRKSGELYYPICRQTMDLALIIIFLLVLNMVIGVLVAMDQRSVVRALTQSTKQSSRIASFSVGAQSMGSSGRTAHPSMDKAMFRKTTALANSGEAFAQCLLGKIYQKGAGGVPNMQKAIYWYEKASLQGHSEAQYLLARCRMKDGNRSKTKHEIEYLLRLSAASGWGPAQVELTQLPSAADRRV